MRLRLWLRIGSRNIARNKRRSLIMFLAMTVGLAGVLWFMGFMNSWMDQMVDNIIRSGSGQLSIKARGAFDRAGSQIGFDPLAAGEALSAAGLSWAPRVSGRGLLVGPDKSWPVQIVGIDPRGEGLVSDWPQALVEGELFEPDERGKLLVGRKMIERFNTRLNKKLVIYAQGGDDAEGDFGSAALRIKGIYRSNSPELDDSAVFVSLAEAQSLFGLPGAVTEIAACGAPDAQLDQVVQRLRPGLAGLGLEARSWRELSPLIVQMIGYSRQMMFVFYLVIFVAMAFGVINVLLIAVLERRREFGVLRALGTPPLGLSATIVYEALALGLLACLAGDLIGVLVVHYFHVHGLDLSALAAGMEYVGMSSIVYFRIGLGDVVQADLLLLLVVLLASVYPAIKARRGRPAELLRR